MFYINWRGTIAIISYMTVGQGIFMLIPCLTDILYARSEWKIFFTCAVVCIFLGLSLGVINKSFIRSVLSLKEGLLLTALAWFIISAVSAIPFAISPYNISYINGYFESMSAFTTTGATVIKDLNQLSPGFHIWRALLQWFGGIGIVLTGVALLPALGSGGMQLFKIEAFETFGSALSKAKSIITGIFIIYTLITIIFIMLLWIIADISFFDSIIHSMTSISTAGFSNYNGGVNELNNIAVDIILPFEMILGASPFMLLYYLLFLNKGLLFKDEQFIAFIKTLIVISLILILYIHIYNGINWTTAITKGWFTIVSIVTGTGAITTNYAQWGAFPSLLILFSGFIGGCAGSSACGAKIFRYQIAFRIAQNTLHKSFLQNYILSPYYNKKAISNQVTISVFSYFFLLFIILFIVTLLLSLSRHDFLTSFSAALTCLMNVGPGLGDVIGPVGNFSNFNNMDKIILSITMFIGRIEIFGALFIFSKKFWKK